MGNIRKFLKYFLPLIALPIISSYLGIFSTMSANALGAAAIAAKSTVATMNNMYNTILHITAIAALSITAILAEKGKVKVAKTVHLICLLFYITVIIVFAADHFLSAGMTLRFMGTPAELIDMGISYARMFVLPVLLVALIAALPSQLSGKHSFILIMAAGAGIIVISILSGIILVRAAGLGILGIALTDGLSFAVSSVAPFLMVPVKSYAKAFVSVSPE